MWCDMICYAMVWYDMIWHDMIWYYMIRYDMMRYDVSWFTMTWYGMICYDMIWHAMIYIYIYIERERGITRIVWTTCWWRVGLSKHMGRRRMSKHVRNVSVICIYICIYTHLFFCIAPVLLQASAFPVVYRLHLHHTKTAKTNETCLVHTKLRKQSKHARSSLSPWIYIYIHSTIHPQT